MMDDESLVMSQLRRQLKGEIVNGHVGIPLRGGPRDGRRHIVQLGSNGQPPPRVRTGTYGGEVWHVYTLATSGGDEGPHLWVYEYLGTEPRDQSQS